MPRRLGHEPFGHRPTTLLIRGRHYKCSGCGRIWRQDTSKAAQARVTIGVPAALTEIRRLGRTLKQRAADILAFFDRPGTSNTLTEAICSRLEHLRGTALGFSTSRTMSRGRCSKPADSDQHYTLDSEEPIMISFDLKRIDDLVNAG